VFVSLNNDYTICLYEEFEDIKEAIRIVNRRRTDNTMAKRKQEERTNNDLQNIHIKLKIE
jgi:hypothetical protein